MLYRRAFATDEKACDLNHSELATDLNKPGGLVDGTGEGRRFSLNLVVVIRSNFNTLHAVNTRGPKFPDTPRKVEAGLL